MRQRIRRIIGVGTLVLVGIGAGCIPNPEGLATDVVGITNTPPAPSIATDPVPTATATVVPSTQTPFTFPATLDVTPVCADSPPTRLILGERARITDEDPTDLNVRSEPGATTNNPPIGKLRVGEVVIVLDGPVCSDRYTWYEVDTGDLRGWIAEGDLEVYYVEPFLGQ